jgi:hypothetical protein
VALTEAQMTASADFTKAGWRYERFDGVSHWLPLDVPERLAGVLLEFFDSPGCP